ncbi:hypothetical protein ACHWQZ_G011698 [Mnemiopsis leidyi]
MEQSDKDGSNRFFQGLSSLSNDRKNADVTIWAGNHQILAHKLVLDINSSIMEIDDVSFKKTNGKYHVYLSAEFEENFELLCNLITSFYTGNIEIGENDVNFVYKFAKTYKVHWLRNKAFTIYERVLTEKTFIQIFQFAHSICCEDLKGLCLDYLTADVINLLLKTGEILKLDYFSINTICDTKSTNFRLLPEIKKFDLVCRWFEADVLNREEEDVISV